VEDIHNSENSLYGTFSPSLERIYQPLVARIWRIIAAKKTLRWQIYCRSSDYDGPEGGEAGGGPPQAAWTAAAAGLAVEGMMMMMMTWTWEEMTTVAATTAADGGTAVFDDLGDWGLFSGQLWWVPRWNISCWRMTRPSSWQLSTAMLFLEPCVFQDGDDESERGRGAYDIQRIPGTPGSMSQEEGKGEMAYLSQEQKKEWESVHGRVQQGNHDENGTCEKRESGLSRVGGVRVPCSTFGNADPGCLLHCPVCATDDGEEEAGRLGHRERTLIAGARQ